MAESGCRIVEKCELSSIEPKVTFGHRERQMDRGFTFANGGAGRLGLPCPPFDGTPVAKMAERHSSLSPLLGRRRVDEFDDDDDEEEEEEEEEEEDDDDDERGKGRKRRRTLRFDSSESSDSGVAALSSTDTSSQSSGTSDITEPCSPPSPETPRSCTPLPATISSFSATRNCLKNCNRPFTTDPLSCVACDCEQNLTFQQVTKACCNTIYEKRNDVADQINSSSTADNSTVDSNTSAKSNGNISDENSFQKQTSQNFVSGEKASSLQYAAPGLCTENDENVQNMSTETVVKEIASFAGNDKESPKKSQDIITKLTTSTKSEHVVCQWDKCITVIKSGFEVVEHLQNVHVAVQKNSKTFTCLWSGCKVYNRTSCSLSWLERHVLSHAGNKPFQCIVDGCGQRFTSQGGLERHVNSHFNQPCSSNNLATNGNSATNPAVRRKDETPTKVLKKKRLRYRRRGWAVKTEDFFDAGTMECVQHHLVTLNNKTKIDLTGTCRTVTFHSNVMARRIEGSGKVRVLVHWIPENIFPDQWILESQVESRSKWTIPLTLIPPESFGIIDPSLTHTCQRLRKNRRK